MSTSIQDAVEFVSIQINQYFHQHLPDLSLIVKETEDCYEQYCIDVTLYRSKNQEVWGFGFDDWNQAFNFLEGVNATLRIL